ncbi:GNAT family N-acetyltransferase [Rubrivirga marina]|uniref:N-acetyltransferase domain-containing protein n=1 Tax=Rubrivirga marina TaxID=1196024 RepID=A0A271IY87_9BACT|nr:GNAT family N-acetyltransferase [Rubrivirga marina]PAP76183.1 hypothetical protein BSZ37_06860 [Rubrivirga marina]
MEGLEIRILGPGDLGVLADVDPDTFDGPVDPRWAEAALVAPDQHLAVALDGTRVVGFAMGIRVVEPDKAPVLYVDEVGTADAYQRRGIATALMKALLDHARALDCTTVWLMTEEENEPARAFYAAIGGTEEQRPVYITFDLTA